MSAGIDAAVGAGAVPAPALVVVGHGTRDPAGVAGFGRLVERVRARAGGLPVAGGFLELSPPPLADAVQELVEAGHRSLAAVPLVLVAASHAKGDIPAALAREKLRHQGLTFSYARPLGPHASLLDMLEQRIDAVLDRSDRPETAVLLVGRGATDPDANSEVAKVARLLWEGRGFAFVETAFVSLAWPDVPQGLERSRRLGARRVVVAPYVLFPGLLVDRVIAQAREFAGFDVRCAGVLGDSDALADLVLERYREAVAGDVRMSCDTCMYRVALPGHVHRVGAPQTPHDHPDDPLHSHTPAPSG